VAVGTLVALASPAANVLSASLPMHKRRYRLLSALAMLVSAPVAFLECIAGSVLMVFGRAN